jgi:hypothetical protein
MLDLHLQNRTLAQPTGKATEKLYRRQTGIAACVLLVIVFACYSNALNANFNCDDFSRIHYAYKIFHGQPELLIRELTSAWPDGSFQLQYRPLFELSFVLDYLLWKANAFGYHLSNLLLHCAATFLLFLTARSMLAVRQQRGSFLPALVAAALYASYPLSCEVVAWVGCRVDSICAIFYFASFWLFLSSLQNKQKLIRPLSLFCFCLSLLSKEMGASLPMVLLAWMLTAQWTERKTLFSVLRKSLWETRAYWSVLVLYIVVRGVILGNLIGGYVGSTGDSIAESSLNRWVNSGCLYYLAYPLNTAFFSSHSFVAEVLHLLCLAGGLLIIWRIRSFGWAEDRMRIVMFSALWFVLSLLPISTVFYISPFLQGGRYIYIPAAALCLLVTTLLYRPESFETTASRQLAAFKSVSFLVLVALLCCFVSACRGNTQCWTDSAMQTIALQSELVNKIKHLQHEQTLVVLNPPKDIEGAYMFFTFELLQKLLMPPFFPSDLSNRIAALEPRFFGECHLLNRSQLKELTEHRLYQFALWDREKLKLNLVARSFWSPFLSSHRSNESTVSFAQERLFRSKGKDRRILTYRIEPPAAPLKSQFIGITLINDNSAQNTADATGDVIAIGWSPEHRELFGEAPWISQPLYRHADAREYLFATGQFENWSLSEAIDKVDIHLPAASNASIVNVRLLSGDQQLPVLKLDSQRWRQQLDGLHIPCDQNATMTYDVSSVPNANGAVIEISQRYSQFQQYTNTLRDFKFSPHAAGSIRFAKRSGRFSLPASTFRQPGWYQIRAAAIAKTGELIGYFGDPIYISISALESRRVKQSSAFQNSGSITRDLGHD